MNGDILPAPAIYYRPASLDDLNRVVELEIASYPADEAADFEKLKFRIENASDFFLVGMKPSSGGNPAADPVIGFVCGTLTTADSLTHESMSTHEPDGNLLCIHSVCVEEAARRQGIGSKLLKAYVNFVQQTKPDLRAIRLLCKEHLVKFYQHGGFSVVGPSSVVHGEDQWIEMVLESE